jgi:hypothetical protein
MNPVPSRFAPSRPFSPARFQREAESGKSFPPRACLLPAQMRSPAPAPRKAFFALLKEPEDAGLTGGTRSLDRRLLGLNLNGTRGRVTRSHPGLEGIQPTAA